MHVEITAGILAALVWTYLLFARGMFWRLDRTLPAVPPADKFSSKVAVVIPARNEAPVIAQSLDSLARQTCAESLRIFVIDDSSTDGTANEVRAAAARGVVPINLISGRPLVPGWTGKLWAVKQGIAEAEKINPDFFLLTDADILHASDEIASLIAIAETGGYDMCSFMVRLNCGNLAEKLLIPAFVYFFFMLYPRAWVRDRLRRIAGAAGGCMLVRPQALARVGGIASIRGELIDDCALASAIKQSGGQVWLGLSAASRSLREYASFAEVGRMISRAAFNQLRHSMLLLAGTILGMLVTYLLPGLLVVTGHTAPVLLGLLVWLGMSLSYWPTVSFYRLNPLWSLLLPVAALFYIGATLLSAVAYWRGRGGQWKGRAQDVRETA